MNLNRLTIANCGGDYEAQAAAGAYACPTERPHGTFENNQYLGLYTNLAVRLLGEVRGVVDIDTQTGQANVRWNNEPASTSNEALIAQARQLLQQMFPDVTNEQRVFVLGDLFATNFRKPTPRGIWYRKTYRNVASAGAANAQELANLLDGRTWDEFPLN